MDSFKLRERKLEKKKETRKVKEGHGYENADVFPENVVPECEMKLLLSLVVFRVINSCLIQSSFVPDEYWQGPEVSHKLVFGYGYLTWEWREGIRGYTFPLIFTALYKILAVLKLDYAKVIILGPKIIQGILAGIGDFYLFKLATKLFDQKVGVCALLCSVVSWFNFYCVTRTVTNSTETVLNVIGMYYWPWDTVSKQTAVHSNIHTALILAGAACLVRPTAAVMWMPLALLHLYTTDKKLTFLCKDVLPIGALLAIFSVIVDSWFFGKLVIIQLNFLQFNVLNNVGAFYGSHPWYWYFTGGIPVIMFTHLILFIPGVLKSPPKYRIIAWLMLWVVSVYSFLDHKEFRFIFPILPLGMCYCGYFLDYLCKESSDQIKTDEGTQSCLVKKPCHKAAILYSLLLITNIPVALYTSLVHQRGTTDVMYYIQKQCETSQKKPSVLFLMPCHSTPFYSVYGMGQLLEDLKIHMAAVTDKNAATSQVLTEKENTIISLSYVHQNITMQFLTCEPSSQPGYIDEADLFYLDPQKWITDHFQKRQEENWTDLPSHIVVFNALLQDIEIILKQFHYKECAKFFHTHFPDRRIGSEVVVYCTVESK